VENGAVVLRLNDGRRTLAAVAAADEATIAAITSASAFPIGKRGRIALGATGRMEFSIA
jgi:hypothetical protein